MPLLETLPIGPDTAQWPLWGTTARLVVTDPAVLPAARAVVAERTAAVAAACSRFADSELTRLVAGRPTLVSPLFAELVGAALDAAAHTGGAVDPTLGSELAALGYDRDLLAIAPVSSAAGGIRLVPRARWDAVRVEWTADGPLLTVPAGCRLDLGATAKAWAADACATAVVATCGGGALVALGGDIATAGEPPAPADGAGWPVLVQDGPGEPAQVVRLDAGGAIATSSTISRTWTGGGRTRHHVLDPASGLPADPVWRTVSVVAARCLDANTASTAAIVHGAAAVPWLRGLGLPARLVSRSGRVVTTGGWAGA
ncbi:FAD:protein FMN transferase [Pseudonocardia ailaonensis]|uniref:FAD:protein FMN transferase n=1 Tax=Pseudonocardia ailaonensis TaxID=367279 RepID=A0ABN2N2U2_9PSEU